MIIEIKRPVTKEKVAEALEKISQKPGKKTLRKHFGKLKRGIAPTAYQRKIRDEWN